MKQLLVALLIWVTPGLLFAAEKNIAILMDCSGSMRSSIADAKEGAIRLVDEADKDVNFAVVSFASGVKAITKLTGNHEQVKQAIRSIRAGGATALYDAVYHGADIFMDREGDHLMVLLTDGRDDDGNGGVRSKNSLSAAIGSSLWQNITIFAIGLGHDVDTSTLETLTGKTGGKFYPVNSSGDLIRVYQRIWRDYQELNATRGSSRTGRFTLRLPGETTDLRLDGNSVMDALWSYETDRLFSRNQIVAGDHTLELDYGDGSRWRGMVRIRAGYAHRIQIRKDQTDLLELTVPQPVSGDWIVTDPIQVRWNIPGQSMYSFDRVDLQWEKENQFVAHEIVEAHRGSRQFSFPGEGVYTLHARAMWGDDLSGKACFATLKVDNICRIDLFQGIRIGGDTEFTSEDMNQTISRDISPRFTWKTRDNDLNGLDGYEWKLLVNGTETTPWKKIDTPSVVLDSGLLSVSPGIYDVYVRAIDGVGNRSIAKTPLVSYWWVEDDLGLAEVKLSGDTRDRFRNNGYRLNISEGGRPDWVK